MKIPFNRPYLTGLELAYIEEAHKNGMLAGDGIFTRHCHKWIEDNTTAKRALLTHSCTAALEMAALLLDIEPGDEIIMPSYTFVSTANAFVLRGAIPVFVDIREDTLNIDETLIESAITYKTRAIVPVHYAGVSCEMDAINNLANQYNLRVVEDAAQGIMSTYKGRALGSIGDLGTFSFHETKNVISGEGGSLLINDSHLIQRAEIIREKGTDRSRHFRGEVDKYSWQEMGSSFLPGEVTSAFLWGQLQRAHEITKSRLSLWERYYNNFEALESLGALRRPIIPEYCQHNAHMFYVMLTDPADRVHLLDHMKGVGIHCVFHYVPLHSSPGGLKYGRCGSYMTNTDLLSSSLIRLPMWIGLTSSEIDLISLEVHNFFKKNQFLHPS